MSGLYVVILGFLAVSCSGHNGYDHRFDDVARPQQNKPSTQQQSPINNFLSKFGIHANDQKCFTVTKRPIWVNRLKQYPCYKRVDTVPVVNSFMSPFGPMCVSYFRERVYQNYRIQTCCPGYAMDKMGRCSIRLRQNNNNINNNNNNNNKPMFQQQNRGPMANMMEMAAKVRQNMWQRAREGMQNRQNMLLARFQNTRPPFMPMQRQTMRQQQQQQRAPMMAQQRPRMPMPPMTPFMNMFNNRRDQRRPKVAFLRFGQPPMAQMSSMATTPPMPNPVVRPPMSRMIRIVKPNFGPMLLTFQKRFPFTRNVNNDNNQQSRQQPQREIQQRIMSNRTPFVPFRGMPAFQPRTPQMPAFRMAQPMYPGRPQMGNTPQMQGPPMSTDRFYNPDAQRMRNDFSQMHAKEGFYAPEPQEAQETRNLQVDLPEEPAQMPDLVVEKAPTNQDSCIMKLETAEQTCLKQSGIDVPDIMTAFEPFNEDISLVLCRTNAVFECMTNELKTCADTNDAVFARDMLRETSEMVRSMCELREISVSTGPEVVAEEPPALSSTEGKSSETLATVESVDAIPDVEKQPEGPAVVEENPAVDTNPTESMSVSAQAFQEAMEHEVHVQELRMKEYLLPILIGSGIGFFVLVLIMSLLVCCCCKRKMKRKMKMARELEKPPLNDEIYTIGVAPPVYEVNGIPPLYYEEAKGEKISSRSSSIQEGTETAPEAEATQM